MNSSYDSKQDYYVVFTMIATSRFIVSYSVWISTLTTLAWCIEKFHFKFCYGCWMLLIYSYC